ncbi:phage tail protein [Vreelandella titanicae]|uniref:phage tail protein n=1 Tax=Vreelandella titanicae TaxID=664683 RepID=UPI0039BFA9A7
MANLDFDIRQLQSLRNRFDPRIVDRALDRSVNATTRKAATFISRYTRDIYDISAGDIRRRVQIQRVNRDASRAILYTGRSLPLAQFKPRGRWVPVSSGRRVKSGPRKGRAARRRGVTVRIRKDNGRQLVQGGWHAKGHILRRRDKADNQSEPLMRFGPSIPQMVGNTQVMNAGQDMIRDDLPRQFNQQMEYLLSRESDKS